MPINETPAARPGDRMPTPIQLEHALSGKCSFLIPSRSITGGESEPYIEQGWLCACGRFQPVSDHREESLRWFVNFRNRLLPP